MDIQQLSVYELQRIATTFNLPVTRSKKKMIQIIEDHYYKLQRFISYTYVRQLGHEGKDGRTFLALDKNDQEVAIKIFKHNKSSRQIEKEATLQIQASKAGITPKVIEYDGRGKYIVMEKLDINLYDLFCKQGGKLTLKQQKDIVSIFKKLDKAGVFHADPNPLNFMYKKNKLYIIDFGFAKPITKTLEDRYGSNPNVKYMCQGLLLKLKQIYPSVRLSHIEPLCFLNV